MQSRLCAAFCVQAFPAQTPNFRAALKRLFSGLAATGLIGGTIFLGIQSGKDNRFVVWFGISSAVAAPLGLALFASAVNRSDSEIISRLAKVPEIEKLINEARTQEEKIKLLEEERMNLAEIVRVESARQAAFDRIDSLERDATRILDELRRLWKTGRIHATMAQ